MSVARHVDYGRSESEPAELNWLDVCALEDIPINCGAPALIGGRQIALVRVQTVGGEPKNGADISKSGQREQVYALSNYDPFSEAFVIARGIVGDRAGCPKIASPIFKQSFDVRTGVCLDDPKVVLPTYPVRVREGRIEVGVEFDVCAAAGPLDDVGRER